MKVACVLPFWYTKDTERYHKDIIGVQAMAQKNPYSLRLDEILMAKVKVIAGEQRRSVNMEIERMVELAVTQYEAENGEIHVSLKNLK